MTAAQSVFFDWDGTLCDSARCSLRAYEATFREFGIQLSAADYPSLFTPDWYRVYEAFSLDRALWQQADIRWRFHYEEERPDLLPGAADFLELLARRGVVAGIVTGGTRRRIDAELQRLGLTERFAAVVCHEDVRNRKPHPEGLEAALALTGVSRESCWYAGDTPDDLLMGRHAGVRTAGILSEFIQRQDLENCHPDVLLNNVAELAAVLFGS